jgi:hypothetical protein
MLMVKWFSERACVRGVISMYSGAGFSGSLPFVISLLQQTYIELRGMEESNTVLRCMVCCLYP